MANETATVTPPPDATAQATPSATEAGVSTFLDSFEKKAGVTPAPAPEEQQQPLPDIPSWDAVRDSPTYKGGNPDERRMILQKYAEDARARANQLAKTPEELDQINKNLDQFVKTEASRGDYNPAIETAKALGHGAISETTRLAMEPLEIAASPLSFLKPDIQPGVRLTTQNAPQTVDQAKDQLAVLQSRQAILSPQVERAKEYQASKLENPNPMVLRQKFPEFKSFQDASNIIATQSALDSRIGKIQNFIQSGGDKSTVTPDVEKKGLYEQEMGLYQKAQKFVEKNVLPPDEAFAREHPLLNNFSNSLGALVPYLATEYGTAGIANIAGLGEHAVELGKAANDLVWTVDSYQHGYQQSLAIIDDRIKRGEDISPSQRELMARNSAAISLFGAPLAISSNMLASKLIRGGVEGRVATGIIDAFVNNVLLPGMRDTGQQMATMTGYNAVNALGQQLAGVKPFDWKDVVQGGAETGGGFGLIGAAARGFHVARNWPEQQRSVGVLTDAVSNSADALVKVNPNLDPTVAKEQAIKKSVPPQYQDAVRAKLGLKESAQALNESSVNALAADSPKVAQEQSKAAQQVQNTNTTPAPEPPKPTEEAAKPTEEAAKPTEEAAKPTEEAAKPTEAAKPAEPAKPAEDLEAHLKTPEAKQQVTEFLSGAGREEDMTDQEADQKAQDLVKQHGDDHLRALANTITGNPEEYARDPWVQRFLGFENVDNPMARVANGHSVLRWAEEHAKEPAEEAKPAEAGAPAATEAAAPAAKEAVVPGAVEAAKPIEGAAAPAAETPEKPLLPQVQDRVKDYLGTGTRAERELHRDDLAHDFLASQPRDDQTANMANMQLLHQLGLQKRDVEHQRTWAANVTPDHLRQAVGRFNQFLDQKIREEGPLAAKPKIGTGPINVNEFNQLVKNNRWEDLHDMLVSGRSLVLPEEVATDPAVDEWLYENKFGQDVKADGYHITPIEGAGGAYQRAEERVARKEQRPEGRPARETGGYMPREATQEYVDDLNKLEPHPSEMALYTREYKTLNRLLSDPVQGRNFAAGPDLRDAGINKYFMELRKFAARMRVAGRHEDLYRLGRLDDAEAKLNATPEDHSDYKGVKEAYDAAKKEVDDTKADRPVKWKDEKGEEHETSPKDLHAGEIVRSIQRDYFRDLKARPKEASFEATYGGEEEGEGTSYEQTVGEGEKVRGEVMRREEEEPVATQAAAHEAEENARLGVTISEEDAEKAGPVSPLDEGRAKLLQRVSRDQHEDAIKDFAKKLRSNREKKLAYNYVDLLLRANNEDPLTHPPNLPEEMRYSWPTREQDENRIAYEYLRFVEDRTRAGRAGEGGEAGGEAAAAAARGGAVPPGHHEENAASRAIEHPRPGEAGDNEAALQSSTPSTRDQAGLAAGEPSNIGPRESVTGLPEPTPESTGGATGERSELLSGRTEGERAERAGRREDAPGAGRVRRDASTGERIIVTPEGNERGRGAPRLTRVEDERFNDYVDKQADKLAKKIWSDWDKNGESERGRLVGIFPEDAESRADLAQQLHQMVHGMAKQEPSYQGRMRIARNVLEGILTPRGDEMSAAELRRQRAYAHQTEKVTTVEQVNRILEQAWGKFEPGFRALGIDRDVREGRMANDAIMVRSDGSLVYRHSPTAWQQYIKHGATEGEFRNAIESVLEEEMIHGAHMASVRDRWIREGKQGNFKDYFVEHASSLLGELINARDAAEKRGDHARADLLDKTLASSVKMYFGGEAGIKGARNVNSFKDFVNWHAKLPEELQDEVSTNLPYELARQMVQLRTFDRTTEYEDRRLLGRVYDWFMGALKQLRSIAIRAREGDLGQAWKDTVTTLEKRVRDLQETIRTAEPPKTTSVDYKNDSIDMADRLGRFFIENMDAAEEYDLRFEDAENAPDLADKIIAHYEAEPGTTPALVYQKLHSIALREGLIDPPKGMNEGHYLGKMASLAPGIGNSHMLKGGRTDLLARYFRESEDPEMREFGKSLTPHLERLQGVNIRQLKHEVPAAFYHNGDLWVTTAALNHPDGQRAIANELQHAIAQEILTKANTPDQHEYNAHATALTNEFKRRLPPDIRDAVDNKFKDLFNDWETTGRLDKTYITDEEKKWLPLIQAASHPTEFIKKAFSSANFRDYLREMKSDRGDPFWDNVHDWGRTLFGDQAFNFSPDASEIAYNRPGVAMRFDPRNDAAFDPLLELKNSDWYKNQVGPLIRKYALDQGPREAMRRIEEVSENPNNKVLARELGAVLEKNPGIGLELTKPVGLGAYTLVGDTIAFSPELASDNNEIEKTLLHEAVHALTSGKISAYLTSRFELLSHQDMRAMEELEQLRRQAILHPDVLPQMRLIANLGGYERRGNAFAKLVNGDVWGNGAHPEAYDFYGLMDLHEFASEALSNENFQKFLAKVDFKREGGRRVSMLDKFYSWLRDFLGFKPGSGIDVALRNITQVMDGQRVMMSDFRYLQPEDLTTGEKTQRMTEYEQRIRHYVFKALEEGYSSPRDVPLETAKHWNAEWESQNAFTQPYDDASEPAVVNAPQRRGMTPTSDELSRLEDPSDIISHISKITGLSLRDGEGLSKAVDNALKDGAISTDQYLSTQDVLKEMQYATLSRVPMAGDKTDPNSPRRRITKWLKDFLPQGNLPKEVHNAILEIARYPQQEFMKQLDRRWQEFDKLVKKHYGVSNPNNLPARINDEFNKVLRGLTPGAPPKMPAEMYNHLQEWRSHIDQMTDALVSAGIVKKDSELYKEMYDNRGHYIARDYKIFHDPRWLESAEGQSRFDAAVQPYKGWKMGMEAMAAGDRAARMFTPGTSEYNKARLDGKMKKWQEMEENYTDEQAERDLREQMAGYHEVSQRETRPMASFGPAYALNDSLLKDLTHLPQTVRELMGEEKDVRKNLVNTLVRQHNYLQSVALAKEIVRQGDGKWMGDHIDPARGWTDYVPKGVGYLGELSGKWMSKEMRDVFMNLDHVQRTAPDFFPGLSVIETPARYMTTILSVKRGIGNVWSAGFSLMQNGVNPLDPRVYRPTYAYLRDMMLHASTEEVRNYIDRCIRYGVLDHSVDPYTLKEMARSGFKYGEMGRGPMDWVEGMSKYLERGPLHRVSAGVGRAAEFMRNLHTAGNDIGKMFQFEAKQRMLREANQWDVDQGRATPMTDDEIAREAAREVRDCNVSYSLASPNLKQMRRVQVVGTFLTFFNELMRSHINQWGYAIKRTFRTDNPVLRRDGINRLAGLIGSYTIAFGLSAASRQMFGVTPREDQNLRKLMPPWEQNRIRVYGPMQNGKRQYFNLDYVLPQGDIARAVIAALTPNKDGLPGAAGDAVMELSHPLYNFGLMPGAMIDVARNQTEYGTQVYNPEDYWVPKTADMLHYLTTRLFGGTLGRLAQAGTNLNKTTPGGTVYDPAIVLGSELLGLDAHEVSIPNRFTSSVFSSKDDLHNAERIFTRPIQQQGNEMTDDAIRATYQHEESVRRIVFQDLRMKVDAARESGMSTSSIRSILKQKGYSTQMIDDLFTGRYHSYQPGKTILENAESNHNHMPRNLFGRNARVEEE